VEDGQLERRDLTRSQTRDLAELMRLR
jgi:hypothetical protein